MTAPLLDALEPVKHCGDYGEAWFNVRTGEAWLVMGDSDGQIEEGFTPFEEIERLAMSVPSVSKVTIADETGPNEADQDWQWLGPFGKET